MYQILFTIVQVEIGDSIFVLSFICKFTAVVVCFWKCLKKLKYNKINKTYIYIHRFYLFYYSSVHTVLQIIRNFGKSRFRTCFVENVSDTIHVHLTS